MTKMTVMSKEQAWMEANKIFPTDYEKDDASSLRAGYDIYRHPSLNYYSRICDLGDRLEVLTGEYGENVTNIWIETPVDEFKVDVIARGSYIDQPYGEEDERFSVEAITVRLNHVALNAWFSSQMHNVRECYEDGEAGDHEWEAHKAEYKRRGEEWKANVLCALAIRAEPERESISITQAQAEVFTAVHIRRL